MELLVVFVIWCFLCVLVGNYAQKKGFDRATNTVLAILFSPLLMFLIVASRQARPEAVEQAAIASGAARKCPSCAELVKAEAVKCRHCGSDLTPIERESVEIY